MTKPTALTAEYTKAFPAKFATRKDGTPNVCIACVAPIVLGEAFTATNDFTNWHNYCGQCSVDMGHQVEGLYKRLQSLTEGLDITPEVRDAVIGVRGPVQAFVDAESVATFLAAKQALFAARSIIGQARKAAQPAKPAAGKLEPGVYVSNVDDTWSGYWRVTLNKAGTHCYAMRLIAPPVEGQKLQWEYVQGGMPIVARSCTPATAEQIKWLGDEAHYCCFCSTALTDDREGHSIDRGYGPICANRYGLPWGGPTEG